MRPLAVNLAVAVAAAAQVALAQPAPYVRGPCVSGSVRQWRRLRSIAAMIS
jgi:hypothetical protein